MTDKQTNIIADIGDISNLLQHAGKTILMPAFQHQSNRIHSKDDGSIVTNIDIECQQLICEQLALSYPDINFLGEEMSEKTQQECLQQGSSFWCLDPLDGTGNFVASFPAFGISLALIDGGMPVLACIHDPVRHETFTAIRHQGAWLNGQSLQMYPDKQLSDSIGFIDFKRLNKPLITRLIEGKHYRSQRNIGSCALEWAWLADGRVQFIIHGNEKLWDYAAGCLLVEEAGGILSDFKQCHPFHTSRLSSSIVAAASSQLHQHLLSLLEQ